MVPDREEKKHLIKTYTKVKENIRDYLDAAIHGAITAMTKNALSQDKILAAPTGGACGVLPGVHEGLIRYFTDTNQNKTFEEYRDALLISGFLAAISSNWVPPSGAQLGCQAETGTGAAMGAAFASKLLGGSDIQIINAFCLALKNSMGFTCDPVAGRVNTPCIKRNGFKALDALNAAFMSLKDVESFIKADEILIAMRETGLDMQSKYRETSEGGLAKTATGLKEKFLNRTNYCC
jgi:L-serine dehydratase